MGGPPRERAVGIPGDVYTQQEKPEELVADIDFGGLSLEAFAAGDAVSQQQQTSVDTYSAQSVDECMSSTNAVQSEYS